jgi:hypothetical protein
MASKDINNLLFFTYENEQNSTDDGFGYDCIDEYFNDILRPEEHNSPQAGLDMLSNFSPKSQYDNPDSRRKVCYSTVSQ